MTVAYVPFAPIPARGFSFQATLDGVVHDMQVGWNIYGQRWFITGTAPDGTVVFTLPVIGSPNEGGINIVAGYFQTTGLVYRVDTGNFEIWS